MPGHGDILSKAELRKRLTDTIARRDAIKSMVDRGMTVEQIKTAVHETTPKGAAAMFPGFTERSYRELSALGARVAKGRG